MEYTVYFHKNTLSSNNKKVSIYLVKTKLLSIFAANKFLNKWYEKLVFTFMFVVIDGLLSFATAENH